MKWWKRFKDAWKTPKQPVDSDNEECTCGHPRSAHCQTIYYCTSGVTTMFPFSCEECELRPDGYPGCDSFYGKGWM
jgi:hypothetical protein